MKQLIVLIATVVLGIILSGTVLGMDGNVSAISDAAMSGIEEAFDYSEGSLGVLTSDSGATE